MANTRAQFFSRKPSSQIIYTTIELYNPTQGVRRFVTGQQLPKSFQLEPEAPRDAGQVVEFDAVGFDAPEPEVGEDGLVSMDIQLGAIGFEAKRYMDGVRAAWPPVIYVVWRQYLQGVDAPQSVLYMQSEAPVIDVINVALQCSQVNLATRGPTETYDPDVFKGLQGLI